MKALEDALNKERMVVFASQKSEDIEEPEQRRHLHHRHASEVVQMQTLPDGTTKILVEGVSSVKIESFISEIPVLQGEDIKASTR